MIVAFTGAGISKASGIPTFSDMPGFREQLTRSFANEYPQVYREMMKEFVNICETAQPNDAHFALAEYNIPIITMNIDGLHQRAAKDWGAETQFILPIHGRLPTREELPYCAELTEAPVLYGDLAPGYMKAKRFIEKMQFGDTFLVIGASEYTSISMGLREDARMRGASIVEIQDNADTKVRQFLERREMEWIR